MTELNVENEIYISQTELEMPVLMCFSVLTPHRRRKIPFQIWHTNLLEPAIDTVGEVRTLAGRGSGIV
jgi:hypothetical protein